MTKAQGNDRELGLGNVYHRNYWSYESVAKGEADKIGFGYILCERERLRNIRAKGQSNLISLADLLESRVLQFRGSKSALEVIYYALGSLPLGNGLSTLVLRGYCSILQCRVK